MSAWTFINRLASAIPNALASDELNLFLRAFRLVGKKMDGSVIALGNIWTTGADAPSAAAEDGDYYFRTSSPPQIWARQSGAWVLLFTLTAYTDEQAQDAAAQLLTTATHSGVSVSYDDAAGRLAITNTDTGSGARSAHEAAFNHANFLTTSLLGAASGVAPLGSDSKVPAIYLPAYVDDVLEFANLAAFPGAGETGKIYTAVDTGRIYRWSGSIYIEISASPGSTDAVPEGVANLYFTAPRALAAAPAVTLAAVGSTPNAQAASLVGQQLQLQPASVAFDGLMLKTQVATLAGFFGKSIFLATDSGVLTSGSDTATVAAGQATTNTNTLKAAIATASSALTKKPGGVVMLPPGTFHIDDTLTINESCVLLVGAGAYGNTDASGTPQTGRGTALFWNSTGSGASVPMVDVTSVSGPTNPAVKNSGVIGITLQCAGNVGIGLRVKSIHWGRFEDIYIVNPSDRGVSTECFVTGTTLGEAADVTKCDFDRVRVRLLESPSTATGFYLDGAVNANTSNSTFRNTAVSCFGAQRAYDIRNTDSNSFFDTRINQSNGATVKPIILRGAATAGQEARGNTFFYLAAGGSSTGLRGIESEGTNTAGVTAPAKNNVIYGYSVENGEPYPLIGTGSTLFYQITGGTSPIKLVSAVIADAAFTNVTNADVGGLVIPANALQAGSTFEFEVSGSVINTTAASNLNISLLLNGAVVATVAAALGTTAVASPGRGFMAYGSFTVRSAGAAGSFLPNLIAAVNALGNFSSNAVGTVAINTTTNNTLALRVSTSAATSTGTVRQGFISQVN